MIKIKFYIVLFFFSITALRMQAQIVDSLSSNSEEFFQQLSGILMNVPSKVYQQNSSKLLERFYQSWSVGRFNKDEKAAIRHLVEKMRKRKLRAYPYLYDYLYGLTLLAESNQPPKSIIAWHYYASKLLDNKQLQGFTDFLSFNRKLFEEHNFYYKKSRSWYYRLGRFHFDYDSSFLLKFDHLNLVIATRRDSTIIHKTSGTYNYDKKLWIGNRGTLRWNRFGDNAAVKIYAKFNGYRFNVSKSSISIDSARLFYKRFFNKPVLGILSDRVMVSPPNNNSSYPRFQTYLNNFQRKNIYPKIDYYGGYEIRGLKLFGKGNKKRQPYIHLKFNSKAICTLRSDIFSLGEEKIKSGSADVTFYLDNDSIYHPDLHFQYEAKNQHAIFYSVDNSSEPVPFYDSYHKMDIYVSAIYWNLNADSLTFKRLRGVNPVNKAKFKSSNYFSSKEFYELQGIDDINPLYVIANYAHTYSTKQISVNSFAAFMNKPEEQIVALFINLSKKGFVVFDSKTNIATLKNRLYHFLDAKSGRTDYDVLHFNSKVINSSNASLNLKSYTLNIYGVPQIFISDSQKVYIYPYNKRIAVHKNRDFSFNGKVHAGLFDFYAHNSTFVYDSFMLNLNYIDSMAFQVKIKDSVTNKTKLMKVGNVLQKMNARLYIDKPYNKSGKRRFPEYPKLYSEAESYVYFNRKSIQDSSLWPEKFYYKVDPFVFDSLLTFSTKGLAFKGELNSGGIFPIIKQPLIVMPDFSLGFFHHSPPEGYPLYGGKAIYGTDIKLDNSGFTGNGLLKYLSLKTTSNRFVFYPDSLVAYAWDFTGKACTKPNDFPYIDADSVFLSWKVDTNVMSVHTKQHPFILYNNSNFAGSLKVNPKYLKGNGVFRFDRAAITSRNINFKHSSFTADSSDFVLQDSSNQKVEFTAQGYFASINFDKQKGWFNHLYKNTYVKFPANQYISTLDEVEWLMNEDRLSLSSKADTSSFLFSNNTDVRKLVAWHGAGPEFISVKPGQDSLHFYARKAFYNIRQTSIDVEGVPMIKVADAVIFPYKRRLKILANAQIETLENAWILMDTITFYHRVYDAQIDIFSRKQYMAKATIDYKDINGTVQPINLSSVSVNNEGVSVGFGQIPKEEVFFLSPYYFYYGGIGFIANRKFFRFTGAYQLNQDCIDEPENWVAYDGELNPKNIEFKIDNTIHAKDSLKTYFGLAYSNTSHSYYPLAPGNLKSPDDQLLLNATGLLNYDTLTASFRVGSNTRFENNDHTANYVSFNTKKCILTGYGSLKLGLETPMVNILSIGEFKHFIIPDSTKINTILFVDFFFDKTALKTIADSLRLFTGKPLNLTKGVFPMALIKLFGAQKGGLMLNEIALYGKIKKTPPKLQSTLGFNNLHLVWNKETNSFISNGPIGLGNVANEPINKYFNGFVQLKKGRGGSEINILLRQGKRKWYFFSYSNNVMQFISSDQVLNDYITGLEDKKRILNPNSDENYYEFTISTMRKSIDFLREMEKIKRK